MALILPWWHWLLRLLPIRHVSSIALARWSTWRVLDIDPFLSGSAGTCCLFLWHWRLSASNCNTTSQTCVTAARTFFHSAISCIASNVSLASVYSGISNDMRGRQGTEGWTGCIYRVLDGVEMASFFWSKHWKPAVGGHGFVPS